MQTPGERQLIQNVAQLIMNTEQDLKVLNIGAGDLVDLESWINEITGKDMVFDRIDIADCYVDSPVVGECFITSVESMPEIQSNQYDIAFANFVLEHVVEIDKAAAEIHRILKPSGHLVTSVPNPSAPEFIVSRLTPLKFHKLIKGRHSHETAYAFKSIKEFVSIFEQHFSTVEVKLWAFTLGYLYRFPVINLFGKAYDKIVDYLNLRALMGNVCITLKK